MKKEILFLCTALMLALCLCATGALAKKNKCVEIGYDWDGDGEYAYALVWLNDNGTFFVPESQDEGTWERFGGALNLQFATGCLPLYAGKKSRGFMECTDNSTPLNGDSTYTLKNAKRKRCVNAGFDNGTADSDGILLLEDGPGIASPE